MTVSFLVTNTKRVAVTVASPKSRWRSLVGLVFRLSVFTVSVGSIKVRAFAPKVKQKRRSKSVNNLWGNVFIGSLVVSYK